MTWGSNASWRVDRTCRFCGVLHLDDTDDGLSTHELACDKRPRKWLAKLWRWMFA